MIADAGGKLTIDTAVPPVLLAGLATNTVSDCAFGDFGLPAKSVLLVTTNKASGANSRTYTVDETTGVVSALPLPGTGDNEVVTTLSPSTILIASDTSSTTSPAARYSCGPF